MEHAKGPPFSNNQRTTIQLPTQKNVPQEMETTPSGGLSMVQTGAGQFDGNRGTLVSLDVEETQQEAPWNSTHDWWGAVHIDHTPMEQTTNSTQRKMRTWKTRPTTDCKGSTEARKGRKNGQGMAHGMPGVHRDFNAVLTAGDHAAIGARNFCIMSETLSMGSKIATRDMDNAGSSEPHTSQRIPIDKVVSESESAQPGDLPNAGFCGCDMNQWPVSCTLKPPDPETKPV